MSWHHLVNQIINIEKREIQLYQQIANGAPTAALRDMVMSMAEHERRELSFWHNLLHSGGYAPGDGYYPPGGSCYPPGSGYYPPGGTCPPGDACPPDGWAGTPLQAEQKKEEKKEEKK
jgi:hypothetical protein